MTKEEAANMAELIIAAAPRYRDSGMGKVLVEMAEAPQQEVCETRQKNFNDVDWGKGLLGVGLVRR